MSWKQLLEFDRNNIWHPYTSLIEPLPVYPVESASGVRIKLADGRELIDGMSSWWCVIHGYNHPALNEAVRSQTEKTSHVMFGGLTHEPAIKLAEKLVEISPAGLDKVFFSDSGSVSVEVALKMALQYWQSKGMTEKTKFVSLKRGYHGDTFGAMSVCDPETGMHSLFSGFLPRNYFVPSPECAFHEPFSPEHVSAVKDVLEKQSQEIAAFILEPIVQGAGGMWMYSPDYLREIKKMCLKHDILLIADEIATGFGRTGKLFACEHAHITPDIMCLGKALTGGYMSLAATLCTSEVSTSICGQSPGVFMHGPTFMANPLACATASVSLELLLDNGHGIMVKATEDQLKRELSVCSEMDQVKDVRVLGAIGVVEMKEMVNVAKAQKIFVDQGVWIRPFLNLIYIMPPYIIEPEDLSRLTRAIIFAARSL